MCSSLVTSRCSRPLPLTGPVLRILRPTDLADELVLGGVQLFAGGQCLAEDCPYAAFSIPAPDLGKWGGLLSLFEES